MLGWASTNNLTDGWRWRYLRTSVFGLVRAVDRPPFPDRLRLSARFWSNRAIPIISIHCSPPTRCGRWFLRAGGGPGYFHDAFSAAGAHYLGLDPDVGELSARGTPQPGMIRAS